MKINRIIKGSVDLVKSPKDLRCPNCNEKLGTKINLNGGDKKAYRMIRSVFHTREADY